MDKVHKRMLLPSAENVTDGLSEKGRVEPLLVVLVEIDGVEPAVKVRGKLVCSAVCRDSAGVPGGWMVSVDSITSVTGAVVDSSNAWP